jgi:hypothetical protein
MTTLELRQFVGLDVEKGWPKKLTFSYPVGKIVMATLQQVEIRLHGLGYVLTSHVNNGVTMTCVFMRPNGNPAAEPEVLLKRCVKQFMIETDAEKVTRGGLTSGTWELIDEINAWLEHD